MKLPDIDIDVTSHFNPKNYFNCVNASIINNNQIKKHNVGVYLQNIPVDPITKLAAIPYNVAGEYHYFKIDMLHLSVLDIFENKQQMRDLLKIEPDWSILRHSYVVEKLFQLSKHYEVIDRIRPKSILEIADCMAIIRPGKRKYLDKYCQDRNHVRKFLYMKESETDFKKSHAIAYAHIVVLQLHLIVDGKI